MQSLLRLNQFRRFFFLAIGVTLALSCQMSNVVQQYAASQNTTTLRVAGSTIVASPASLVPSATPTETATPTAQATPIATIKQGEGLIPSQRPTYTPTSFLPSFTRPNTPVPNSPAQARIVAPTPFLGARSAGPAPAKTPTPARIFASPTPGFQYHVNFSWCGPNWLTFVEGTVSLNGIPQNGLLVRISQGPDGLAAWNDYKTGTDPVKPGGYTQIIDANAPHEGLWYLWIVDPQTNKRISEIAIVKTDPKHIAEASCQSANVNFSN